MRADSVVMYLIYTKDTLSDTALWWKPDRQGYTIDVREAGRYTKEEALSQEADRDIDFAIPESAVLAKVRHTVEDCVALGLVRDRK